MKIDHVTVRCVNVPMPPHRTASGVITSSPLVLTALRTSDGVEGHAMLFTYTPLALRATAEMVQSVATLVTGRELQPATLWDELQGRFRLLGTHGLTGMALAALDMALWDAQARAAGRPLHEVLGCAARAIPAYGGVGFDGVAGSAEAAAAWAKQGLKGVKAKIGYPTVDEDVAVVRAMREAVGPGVAVMVDYNQSLSPTEAARRLRVLDGEGLHWVEEPVLAHDFAALGTLARDAATPLQAGENWWGPLDFRHAIDAGARDHAMIDVMKCGGVTGWMRIAAMAHAHGIPVSSHLWPEISAQLLSASPTAAWLEYADWWNPVLQQPLALRDGCIDLAGVLGTGVAFDEAAVQRYAA